MERKDLRVNVDKTKGMLLLCRNNSIILKVDPCGVCSERVGCNSIQCTKCQGGFIVVALMCLGRSVYYCVRMSLSVEHVLVIIFQ